MKENEKTLMLSCDMRDINLIGKGAIEVINVLEAVLKKRPYCKEDIQEGIDVLLNIKEYTDNMKKLRANNDASNYESTECDYKPEQSIFDLRDSLDENFWNAIS